LRATLLSVPLAAGFLGAVALSDAADAQNYNYGLQPYWSGAPNAASPAGMRQRRHGRYASGYPMNEHSVAAPAAPYWSGAPNAAGPAGVGYANNGPSPFLPFALLVYGAANAAGTVVGGAANAVGDAAGAAGNTAGAVAGGPYHSTH
jgi:hypothetical protein